MRDPHGIARALRRDSSRSVVLDVDRGVEGDSSRSHVRGPDGELAEHRHILLVQHGRAIPEATQQVPDTIVSRAVLRLGEAYMQGHEPTEEDWESGFAANVALQFGHLAERGHTRNDSSGTASAPGPGRRPGPPRPHR